MYDRYRLMRIFPGIAHPDGVRALPAHFASWALAFDRVEREADQELQAKRDEAMWG